MEFYINTRLEKIVSMFKNIYENIHGVKMIWKDRLNIFDILVYLK